MERQQIERELRAAMEAVCAAGRLQPGAQMVIGCSTSEIVGGVIGHASAPEVGAWVAETVLAFCAERGYTPVFQCCEHLNRALVIPLAAAEKHGYDRVCAVPQPKAGGSVPAAAWTRMEAPALVTHVRADAGLDIGDTLIGMHLRDVAVPFRCPGVAQIGQAHLTMAYTRLPFIGGSRAVYG